MRLGVIVLICLSLSSNSLFAEGEKASDKKTPVQKAPKVSQGNVPRPEITIVEGDKRLVKEYRINGQLRAIKVTPTNGFPPYYLIDRDGTGEFQKIGPDMGENVVVPNWILIEW